MQPQSSQNFSRGGDASHATLRAVAGPPRTHGTANVACNMPPRHTQTSGPEEGSSIRPEVRPLAGLAKATPGLQNATGLPMHNRPPGPKLGPHAQHTHMIEGSLAVENVL